MEILPQDCLCKIISLTSPLDSCRYSLVSTFVKHAAESDVVWERFLPYDYHDIVSRVVKTVNFSSKKELYTQLCMPTLIDNGTKIFKLEKCSGKKAYILSARELSIVGSYDPMYWCWKTFPESRFKEAAELRQICGIEIFGNIKVKMLSPNTSYGAYLVMKISGCAYGLDRTSYEVSIEKGDVMYSSTAYLCQHGSKMECLFKDGQGRIPREREDGWMEIELGEFFNGECDEEVKMSLLMTNGYHLKAGLIVEGIELRPKY